VSSCYHIIIRLIYSLIAIIFFYSCSESKIDGIILLTNSEIEVGILPEVGGRIVLLRKPGKDNILKSDSSLWINADQRKPEITPSTDFVAFNGNITWIGPQKEWWVHQNLNIERKENKADWPPEPYLIYSAYQITEQTKTFLKLVGPVSPINGLRLTKEYRITNGGEVEIKVTAKNERKTTVKWDLWMLTRLDGFARAYVPISESGILELVIKKNNKTETTPYKVVSNHFTFDPSLPSSDKNEQVQEVHLYPSRNYIVGFGKNQMLLINFDKIEKNLIHPNHGLVELYSFINKDGDDTLLELEVHGAYKTLKSGEIMTLTETWKLKHYNGENNSKDHLTFLKKNLEL